jgi:hypothetical protein
VILVSKVIRVFVAYRVCEDQLVSREKMGQEVNEVSEVIKVKMAKRVNEERLVQTVLEDHGAIGAIRVLWVSVKRVILVTQDLWDLRALRVKGVSVALGESWGLMVHLDL